MLADARQCEGEKRANKCASAGGARAPTVAPHTLRTRGGHPPVWRRARLRPPRRRARDRLVAVAARRAPAARLFELATLGAHVGLDGRVRHAGRAEVLRGLAPRFAAAEQDRPLAERRLERQLVQREALTASFDNARARGRCEAQRAHRQLWHVEEADVVRHRANHNRNLALIPLARHKLGDRLDRHGRPVRLGREEPLQHDLVEFGVRPPREEAVQLHDEPEVQILGDGSGAARLLGGLAAASLDVDTHGTDP
mmetsp:Transcript_26279/g.84310  ORF Transcript_26279/g.84310 Transcript_26279/m.84310 type:complete len:254 (-) Transcript_26279:23-784(-)|eukprot:CAMPEP_0185368704 /NCGR_PEP_ID=MMETSP1364-20130426/15177_1 /TAXON_ID=38817 /ORGANISM="Gephyrocapsa oceanica, Strain RCC1303" /LENGTH=253 /DNA_ID=CAMNT_0027969397 /DNA_START=185 /DNA_END=946 /DNA_ORIENTATION=-